MPIDVPVLFQTLIEQSLKPRRQARAHLRGTHGHEDEVTFLDTLRRYLFIGNRDDKSSIRLSEPLRPRDSLSRSLLRCNHGTPAFHETCMPYMIYRMYA